MCVTQFKEQMAKNRVRMSSVEDKGIYNNV